MDNKYLRLFVARTKLMTAEKMRLDRFCQHGEYLAYKIALPPAEQLDLQNIGTAVDVKFIFAVDLEDRQYHFTESDCTEGKFATFEMHLSSFLNELFRRKTEFEKRNEEFRNVMAKLTENLSVEEQRCLALNIDVNPSSVLHTLGVADNK